MTTVVLQDLVAATDKGPDLITKWAANDAALRLDSAAKDSATASNLALIQALQQQLAAVSAAIYTPPIGSYAAPAAGGVQIASGNANLWSAATLVSRTQVSTQLYNAGPTLYADAWGPNADFTIETAYINSAYSMVLRRFSRTAAGVQAFNSSITLASSGQAIIAATVISNTQVAVTLGGTTYLVTWDGNVTLSSINITRGPTQFISPSNYKRGLLVGTASLLTYAASGSPYLVGGVLGDRALTATTGLMAGLSYQSIPTLSQDYLGGGYVVRLGASIAPGDQTARATVYLEYWDDNGCEILQKLRIPGRTIASVVSCVAFSSTLVLVQWLDTSSTRYNAMIGVNTTTNVLSLYGPYTAGNLGSNSFAYPATFDPLDVFFSRLVTASTGAMKLMRATFNPAGAVGSELTSSTANDINFAIGTSTGSGIAAVAGLTSTSLFAAYQPAPNILVVLYFALATTNAAYLDVFALS